jgi:site-specific DNA-methyltransferase (adenine-specific)
MIEPYYERADLGIKIFCGDCLEIMPQLEAGSVDAVVTSPPYDNLRAYCGYVFDFAPVPRLLLTVIKPGGVVAWIVGDMTVDGSETGTSFRQALAFKDAGFRLHDTMIYHKTGLTFPETNRYYPSFEYMFILSKGQPKTVNLISDKRNRYAGQTIHSTQREVNGDLTAKHGKGSFIPAYSIRQNIWSYSTGGNGQSNPAMPNSVHPATFPNRLAADHIISWTADGDTILDPFLGSGTTLVACVKTGRRGIGIEIESKYCRIAADRIEEAAAQGRLQL